MFFKDLRQKLNEGTQDVYDAIGEQKGQELLSNASKKSKEVQDLHSKLFPSGTSHEDLGSIKNEIPSVVHEHIKENGDELNHETGNVKLKSGREVSVDKYLGKSLKNKSKEEQSNINSEWQHHTRNKEGNTKLVLSRHPGDVASCSTNTHWNSCANLKDNPDNNDGNYPARSDLPYELKHGTMIALHVHKDTKPAPDGSYNSKDILGRTLIKLHHGDKDKRYFREERNYGKFPKDAEKLVDEHLNSKQPEVKSEVYYKDHSLYDDDNKSTKFISPNSIDAALDHPDLETRAMAIKSDKATTKHIDKALGDSIEYIRLLAVKHKNATPEHIDKALDDKDSYVRTVAISNPRSTKENITKALDDKSKFVRQQAIRHHNVTSEHIDKALDDSDENVKRLALEHKKATKENFKKASEDFNEYIRNLAKEKLKNA